MIEENNQLSKLDKDEIFRLVSTSKEVLEKSEFNAESLQQTLNNLLELTGQKPAILFSLIRLVVSWAPFSPALNETLAAIGKDRTIKRLDAVINCL
jgi:glutamyl-tRNA synthetase